MRALIVDDSRFARKFARGLLEQDGIDCEEAADARYGLERLHSGAPFDLVLEDWNMPGISGLEMVQRVREEGFKAVKLMMVTAVGESGAIVHALEAGADEYLMKPFDGEAMREKLALLGLAVA
jgi:two-component system chemotaxis response regulator CheY